MTDPELNKIETWIAEHSIRIFLVIAALICIGAFFAVKAFVQSGEAAREVDVLKPQVTKIVRAAATCSGQTIKEKETSNACAARLRFALIVCRRSAQCRAAFLAIVNYPPPAHAEVPSSTAPSLEGVMPQTPSHAGHQQPSPGSQPGHEGGQGNGHGDGHSSPAETAPGAPQGGSEGDTPADTGGDQEGGDSGSQGGSSSGAGVEVCVEGVTCIGAEAGLPKLKGTP